MKNEKFLVLRTMVALAHVDGRIAQDEHEFISNLIKRQGFSAEECKQLEADFKKPQNPVEMFERITDPKNRGWVIDSCRQIFFKDGDYAESERRVEDRLKDIHGQSIDFKKLVVETQKASFHVEKDDGLPQSFGEYVKRLATFGKKAA